MSNKQSNTEEGSPPAGAETTSEAVPTCFSPYEKKWVLFLASFAGMLSPISSFVFYPAITPMANSLGVTVELVNLAVTTYMVVSGIIPAVLGNAADMFGRRPIYLLALSIYFVANLGLSLQNTYAGLLVLRMLQSAGSSGTISLGFGVISDITIRSERGSYVGILLLGPSVASPVGPIIGGALTAKLGWKWIFWFLCILTGTCLALVLFSLPETSRVILSNEPLRRKGIYRTLFSLLADLPQKRDPSNTPAPIQERQYKRALPNPLECLKLVFLKDVGVVLFVNGVFYTICCCILASLSSIFMEVYNYESLESGLIYIPYGVGCIVATFVWGKVLDFDYARITKKRILATGSAVAQENCQFPIAKARLCSALYLVATMVATTIAYGWVVHFKVHVAAALVLQAFIGFSGTGLIVALGTLLTDLNPDRSSTASAASNLVRCALAATALAVLQLIINSIGAGWCFTIFGVMGCLCVPLMVWLMRFCSK